MDAHKFYGVITLLEAEGAEPEERWSVNKHKTNAEELQDLCDAIFPSVKELLMQAAQEHAITLQSEIADDVGRKLTEALSESQMKKERRNVNAEEHAEGTVLPRNTGARRRRSRLTQAGQGSITMVDNFSGKRFSIITVADNDRFGWVEGNRHSNKVYIGLLHEYWLSHSRNRDIIELAAMALLSGYCVTSDDENQPVMYFAVQDVSSEKKFQDTLGKMAMQVSECEEVSV